MRIALAVSLVAVLALAWRLNSMNTVRGQQQEQIRTLTDALADRSKKDALASQTQCAETASRSLLSRGWKASDVSNPDYVSDYKNHFNSRLNKCFVLFSSYLINNDLRAIDLYDAAEGARYATYNGHDICDPFITGNPKKCVMDSGSIWFDGNDSRRPADFIVGFRGLRYGGGAGDENSQKTFLEKIQPFMNQ